VNYCSTKILYLLFAGRLHYAARNNALLDLGPKLKRYWSFKPNITKGKEVTSIAPHPTNGVKSVVAVL
jgi:hypothetical protein